MCPKTRKDTNYSLLSQGEITDDDSEPASDTGLLRSWAGKEQESWQQPASSTEESSLSEGTGYAGQWGHWQLVLTLNHTRPDSINCVNCKEGALSKQADPKCCRIKEYPSLENPRLAPSTWIKIKNSQHQGLFWFGSPGSLALDQVHRKCSGCFNQCLLFSLPSTYGSFSW